MIDGYNSIGAYTRHIDIRPDGLGATEEKRLSRIIKHSNSQDAKDKAIKALVDGNLGLVLKCATDLFQEGRSFTYMDLVCEGNYWLFYSAKRFDYRKDCRFNTYVYPIIRWKLLLYIYNNKLIHVPYSVYDNSKNVRKLKDKYGDKLTVDILSKELGMTPVAAELLDKANSISMTSLDKSLGDEDDKHFGDLLKDELAPDPSNQANSDTLKAYIGKISKRCLTKKERELIELMFLGEDIVDPVYLAEKLKVSPQMIRSTRDSAIRKLRRGFFDNWDIKHKEDRIDKEALYKEVTGAVGLTRSYLMRTKPDARFTQKLDEKYKKKSKKIFSSLI